MNGNTMKKKMMSLLLVAAMVLTTLGVTTLGNTAYAAENEITVYVSLSDSGALSVVDGKVMANIPVTVEADGEGKATAQTVIEAFHDAYCPGGFAISGGWVTKFWGVDYPGTLFARNGEALWSTVDAEYVVDGDCLDLAITKDNVTYADYYTFFEMIEETETTVTLALKGYMGMGMDHTPAAIPDAEVYCVEDGTGTQIPLGLTTDAEGKVTIDIENDAFEVGKTYFITAKGTIATQAMDWTTQTMVDVDAPITAPAFELAIEAEEDGNLDSGDQEDSKTEEDESKEESKVEQDGAVETEKESKSEAEQKETAPATGDYSALMTYLVIILAAAGMVVSLKKEE